MTLGAFLISTLFLGAYQLSLYFVQKQQMARTTDDARNYARWAVRLAPGAFDPLYTQAASALQSEPLNRAAPAVERLIQHYPFVPASLSMMGYLRIRQGDLVEARTYLNHALANDPGNIPAKQLLDALPPPH